MKNPSAGESQKSGQSLNGGEQYEDGQQRSPSEVQFSEKNQIDGKFGLKQQFMSPKNLQGVNQFSTQKDDGGFQ